MKVLSFDPSMAHTAAVVVDFGEDVSYVHSTWEYVSEVAAQGMRGYLELFPTVASRIEDLVDLWSPQFDVIVHEMPPSSAKITRPESALLASCAIRMAASRQGRVVIGVDPRMAKKIVVGNPNATKPMVRQWFKEHLSSWTALTNEHKRDAALVAIAWMLSNEGTTVEQWLKKSSDEL